MKERRRRILPRLSLLAVLCAAAITIGCGGAVGGKAMVESAPTPTGTPSPTATPTASPLPTMSPTPQPPTFLLEVPTMSISFGGVPVGESLSERVAVLNTGTENVQLTSVKTSGLGFIVSGPQPPISLSPGDSSVFTIVFAPPIPGSDSGTVSFVSIASNSPNVIMVSGSGIAANSHSVDLIWNASVSAVVGYYIYRGSQSRGPYHLLNTTVEQGTAYSDRAVQPGATYYYVVTAVDSAGAESAYSDEASAVVPTP